MIWYTALYNYTRIIDFWNGPNIVFRQINMLDTEVDNEPLFVSDFDDVLKPELLSFKSWKFHSNVLSNKYWLGYG